MSGLNKNKRKDVFSYIRNTNFYIFCLQDTHFTPENENIIRSEWGFNCYFNSLKSNARAVAIFFKNNFEVKVTKEKKDNTGNFLALELVIEGDKLTLITMYGPNIDTPMFYDNVAETINDFNNDLFIICGDFNLVMHPKLDYDKNYKHINNPKAIDKVIEIVDYLGMIDIYREQHPENKRYTWRKSNPIKQTRLDFFLISE